MYGFIRISDSLWVRIFRYTPDTFYSRIILHILLYQIHIRSIRRHWNIDHLNSKMFGDCKMSVISRYRAKEFYLVKLCPRGASHDTMCHRSCNSIIHYVQAGVTKDDNIVLRYFHHIRKKLFCFFDSIDHSIVTAIYSFFADKI